jgi:FKBP-type peptidyl-prolyl cis-trans isomerase 2
MKKTYILLSLIIFTLLSSCHHEEEVWDIKSESSKVAEENILETNIEDTMAELTGNVVIDMNHALAWKTLIFDVEAVAISSKGSGSLDDTIESWDAIEVHYTGTLEDGEKFDSSKDRGQTLPFTVWAGQMIPGFDAGVVGMKIGESKVMTLAPEEAYGVHDETKTQTIPKKDLASFVAAGISLEVGEKLPTQYGEFTIIEVTE